MIVTLQTQVIQSLDQVRAFVAGNVSVSARVKVVVASVMQPTAEYRYPPNASL
jgi:hypothetical protein